MYKQIWDTPGGSKPSKPTITPLLQHNPNNASLSNTSPQKSKFSKTQNFGAQTLPIPGKTNNSNNSSKKDKKDKKESNLSKTLNLNSLSGGKKNDKNRDREGEGEVKAVGSEEKHRGHPKHSNNPNNPNNPNNLGDSTSKTYMDAHCGVEHTYFTSI